MEIRALDYGFTTDVSPMAFIIKATCNGIGKALTDAKAKIPTHIFQYVEVAERLKVMEMVVDKNDKNKMRLTMNSVTRYEKNGPLGLRVVGVRRCALYDDPTLRAIANDRHVRRWADGRTEYDIGELFGFLPGIARLFGIKNDRNRLVCSSEAEDELNKDGFSFGGFPLERSPQGVISPWDIYTAKFAVNHCGNKYPMITL